MKNKVTQQFVLSAMTSFNKLRQVHDLEHGLAVAKLDSSDKVLKDLLVLRDPCNVKQSENKELFVFATLEL